ncbi:MAG: orotidine-5'-phosphate decarboxylase [Candidatus Edwardsbacteria bacterium]|nr:orotidine-5'-phosphate decarboxylase [Candidatus Edwardsbacteria bacterium]
MNDIPLNQRLIVALDVETFEQAVSLTDTLKQTTKSFKVGSQLFTACGPRIVEHLKEQGLKVFLDLKYHDIPNTVARAVAEATALGADIINMHAMGGFAMMEAASCAALETAREKKTGTPLLLSVTVLTSMDEATFREVLGTPGRAVDEQVLHLARLTAGAGLDGVVASPHEIALLRRELGPDFVILTPGIRPAASDAGDQKRFMTPGQAVRLGADYLVVGRPITGAADPETAASAILTEMENALS